MTPDRATILRFIDRFTGNGQRQEVIDAFSCGCCYWFADILWNRFAFETEFKEDLCYLVYDPIINHWACSINGRIYDITGDISDNQEYKWQDWGTFQLQDKSLTKRLYRDCINFGNPEEE